MKSVVELCRAFKEKMGYEPHEFQKNAWEYILKGNNVVVSAGTGSGKTEAALIPALETDKRLVLLYPTKALLQDQQERIKTLLFGQNRVKIAVDTGDEDDISYYSADIILTNLDKFLYRMFGYGKKRYSYLFPYRIAGMDDQRKPLIIFDEAHAYDGTIFSHFWFVLKKLTYERQVQTILLSATLPPALIEALRDQQRKHFPRPASEGSFFQVVEDKQIRTGQVFWGGFISSINQAIELAWQKYQQGKRVIMVMRRVVKPTEDEDQSGNTLQETWEKLCQKAAQTNRSSDLAKRQGDKVEGSILTYHGHQMPSYRRLVLEQLKTLDDAKQPYLLLTTSAMEVGVDVSCVEMITDLCEPDSFVQRIGRCARRKDEQGTVYVIQADPAPPGTACLRDYLQNLSQGTKLDATCKAKLNEMNEPPQFDSIHLRLEYVQDVALYRYIYDFVQENKTIWEHGILITREWEPAIPVVRSEICGEEKYIGGIPEREFWRGKEIKEKVLLPVSCAAYVAPFCAWIFDTFNDEFHQPQRIPLGGKRGLSLKDALLEAGYSIGFGEGQTESQSDENKSKPQYAVGFPLILLLGEERAENVFKDENLGFTYQRRFVKPKRPAPSPQLRVRQVELCKSRGQIVLPLYWYEPVEGG
jgi:CRISPR-associated endonuclease/helicase Cas3